MVNILLFSFLTNFFYYSLGSVVLRENKTTNYSIFYKALIGVITASFIALLLNFFTPLNKGINSFILILIFFIFFLKLKVNIKKKEIIKVVLKIIKKTMVI